MFGVQQHLSISLCEDAHEAEAKGHFYRPPDFKPIEIDQVVVVKKGTEEGNPTVDLVLKDADGNKFVVMVTGRLLQSIPLNFN